jgi:saccharopine dehydrogenase-like NADP-dependent oxidoreductase
VLEAFSLEPGMFSKGAFAFVEPMSGAEVHRFPKPVGKQKTLCTLHPEVATLPVSFRDKGVRKVTFKIALDPDFVQQIRFLRDLGLGSHEAMAINGQLVAPMDMVYALVTSRPCPVRKGPLRQHEVVRAIVSGKKGGQRQTHIVDCHSGGKSEWDVGFDLDTAAPPSIAVQMLALGQITRRGAVPPEIAVPTETFFSELARRGIRVEHTVETA